MTKKTLSDLLILDKTAPADLPACMIITGEPGVGKSFNVGAAFPDYLVLQSRPTAMSSLDDWIRKNREEATKRGMKVPPHRMTAIDSFDEEGNPVRDWYQFWLDFWQSVLTAGPSGTYPGFIIDEDTKFLALIYDQLVAKNSTGDGPFKAIRAVKKAATFPLIACRRAGKGLMSIAHWAGTSYVGKDDPDGRSYGQVEWPAGPAYPVGSMRRSIVQDYDACWQLVAEAAVEGMYPRRHFLIQPSKNAIRKPGFGLKDKAKIEIDNHTNMREVLTRLKFEEKQEENTEPTEGEKQ